MPLTTVSNPKYTVDTRSVYSIPQPREEMEVIYDDYELSGVKMERIDHSDMNNNDPLSTSLTTSSSSSSLQSAHTNRRVSLSSSSELKNSKELEKLGNKTRVQLLECRMKRLEEKRQEVLSKDTELKRKFAELKAKRQALNEIRTPENERPKSRLNRDVGSGEKRRSGDRQSPYDRGSSRKRGLGRRALIEVQSPSERGIMPKDEPRRTRQEWLALMQKNKSPKIPSRRLSSVTTSRDKNLKTRTPRRRVLTAGGGDDSAPGGKIRTPHRRVRSNGDSPVKYPDKRGFYVHIAPCGSPMTF